MGWGGAHLQMDATSSVEFLICVGSWVYIVYNKKASKQRPR